MVFVGFIVVLYGFLHGFGFAFLVIFYFHPLGAFIGDYFFGFLKQIQVWVWDSKV